MKLKLVIVGVLLLGLTSCGFHFPNQNRLGASLTEINVSGSYHSKFYRLVVQKLQVRGVKVYYQNQDNRNFVAKDGIPSLVISSPSYSLPIASINSKESALEYNMVVKTTATLIIPNHNRPIVMRNGLTRTTLNKAENSLASENERQIMLNECYEELANQMVMRINNLGKQTDPDSPSVKPAELLLAKDEDNNDIYIDNTQSMTLIDALQAQDSAQKAAAKSVTLQELNNGNRILNNNRTYNLPKVEPKLQHSAPDLVDEEGNIKNN